MLLVFFAAIVIGAVLLMLPFASRDSAPPLGIVNAFFMATSATCVTGLAPLDVATQFSGFGQAVILFLMQLGGVGIMTFAAFFMVILGKDLSAQNETLITSTIGGEENRSLRRLLSSTIGLALGCELIGTVVIARHLRLNGAGLGDAVWRGLFHSISSFCNAGLYLESGGMTAMRRDATMMAVTVALVIVGSLGFVVISELLRFRASRRGRRWLSLHSSLVLWTLLLISAGSMAAFVLLEWGHALSEMPVPEKLAVAGFQSVAARTSGFTTLDVSHTTAATKFITVLQMFVGGAPGSAAGGIKTTTAAILFMTMVAIARGKGTVTVRSRTIPAPVVGQAVAAMVTMSMLVLTTACALLATECRGGAVLPGAAVFEAFSACGTTGLSLGATPHLSAPGRIILVFAMYLGRIGPLTAAFLMRRAGGRNSPIVEFPEEEVIVG